MVNFIYGSYGCGKTTEILNMIKEDTSKGIHTFLIVPDQEALQFERLSLSLLPPSSQLRLEILGFSRLYNRACREYGGLSYSYITKPVRSLLMWKSLRELSPLLEAYSSIPTTDLSSTDKLIATVNEFKANGVTPAELETAAKKLGDDSVLAKRLRDMALIYACFDNYISEKYSDSADDLSRLLEILKEHDFFNNTNIYIDSFSSFTGVQHKIIEQMMRTAANVTLTFPIPSPDTRDISAEAILDSHSKVAQSAKRQGGYNEIFLRENKRSKNPALAYISENLWRMEADEASPNTNSNIVYEICENRYTEAEAVAAHILELLRKGERCRDMVIIARDAEKYRGILDTALQKSGIPFFFSEKSDLCSIPAVKLILYALRIKKYNWQKRDVIAFIKTGLCDIDRRDASLFEEYINTWNINGSRFLDGEWNMNPDGFTAELSPRAEGILRIANSVRKAVIPPLHKLFVLLDAAETVPDMCRAVYSFLCDISLEDKLIELSRRAADRGELKNATELSRIYQIILNSLADIAEALYDEEADTEEFILILRNIFEKTEIGSIPTSVDEVTVGSASMLRSSNPKYAFIIGLCEGEFPANIKDSGLLSSNDRDMLSSLGIELSGNADMKNSDELMYVARALSAPRYGLYLFTHQAEIDGQACYPSLAIKRVTKLIPSLEQHIFKLCDFEYLVPAPKNAVGVFRAITDEASKKSLQTAISDFIPAFKESSELSADTSECRVSPELVESTLGNSIRFSATSFESYVKCPFGYFCSNILKLRKNVSDRFNAADIGLLVHYILEILIKDAIPSSPEAPLPTDEELIKKANMAIDEYLHRICPESVLESARMKHLFLRLRNLALLLARNTVTEFSQSKFRPAFYELKADGKGHNPSPLVFTLDDGATVRFGGVIDRVDVYKKDADVYIRIVDYKTGSKTFSISDIEHGINLQMLIYLFTLCRSSSPMFKASIGLEDSREALPAGVVYLSSAIPTIEADDYADKDNVVARAEKELVRSGLILGDEELLLAMNNRLDSDFLLGIKRNKAGELTGAALTNADGFAHIFEQISDTVIKLASALRQGNADAAPLEYDGKSQCEYCEARPICRRRAN